MRSRCTQPFLTPLIRDLLKPMQMYTLSLAEVRVACQRFLWAPPSALVFSLAGPDGHWIRSLALLKLATKGARTFEGSGFCIAPAHRCRRTGQCATKRSSCLSDKAAFVMSTRKYQRSLAEGLARLIMIHACMLMCGRFCRKAVQARCDETNCWHQS
jgi:hypothetical protein